MYRGRVDRLQMEVYTKPGILIGEWVAGLGPGEKEEKVSGGEGIG